MCLRNPDTKIMTLEAAAQWSRDQRKMGKRVVVTNGCFDIMHRGHATYLYEARSQGDVLLVAINSDASVQALKGPTRPLVCEYDRAYLLASLECVDAVVMYSDIRATEVFEHIELDCYVKGGDYCEATMNPEEHAALKKQNVDFCFIPFVQGLSTTNLVNKIKETC